VTSIQYATRMPPVARRHAYLPRGTQLEAITARESEVLYCGAAGTGKSRACLEKAHLMCLTFPGMRVLFVRKTQVSLVESGLVTFKRDVVRDMLDREVRWYGGSGSEPAAFRYSNGSVIIIGGMDKASKVLSTEYDLIYVQEATELEEDDWETLTTRLRNGRAPIQQIIADCNPQEPTHWLKQRCDAGKTRMLNAHHTENPLLYDENGRVTPRGHVYMSKLENLSGVRKLRLFMGQWAAAEGVIYEEWSPAIHHITPFLVPDEWPHWWSVDFGYTNPFVWQNWAMNPDGVLFLTQEIYRTETLVQDHALEMAALTSGQRQPQAIITDHDPDGQGTLHRELGRATRGVFGSKAPVSAYKKVKEGIEAVKVRLRSERLFIFQGSVARRDQELVDRHKPTCTADEMPGYIWAEQKTVGSPKDEPLKENDHGVDALRYMVAHLDLVGRPKLRFTNQY
jgi:PBSX family phage terminase large subunit